MHRTGKVAEVEQLTERFAKAGTTIFADYRGLTVAQLTALRGKMRAANAALKVVKNRLAKRAFTSARIAGVDPFLVGPTAIASSTADAAAVAKALVEFAKDNEKFQLKGGVVAGKVVNVAAIKALALLPSREVLLAQLMGLLKAPAGQMANVLAAVPRKLVMTLKAIEGTKQ
ncbi:MAG: 50S ribosomal protein L10 [Deltaproteobacteria bacterium]|nr:50S ribosomal protein L10 [Deltaproteobacteria bacterium]